tara:strand:+ start:337 stop:537 length:201 start_codon:yes stop_codon:yes gene_type:complete
LVDEIFRLSALDIAQCVKKREISCSEVVDSLLDRIEKINPKSNAITVVFEELARRMASELDRHKKK